MRDRKFVHTMLDKINAFQKYDHKLGKKVNFVMETSSNASTRKQFMLCQNAAKFLKFYVHHYTNERI